MQIFPTRGHTPCARTHAPSGRACALFCRSTACAFIYRFRFSLPTHTTVNPLPPPPPFHSRHAYLSMYARNLHLLLWKRGLGLSFHSLACSTAFRCFNCPAENGGKRLRAWEFQSTMSGTSPLSPYFILFVSFSSLFFPPAPPPHLFSSSLSRIISSLRSKFPRWVNRVRIRINFPGFFIFSNDSNERREGSEKGWICVSVSARFSPGVVTLINKYFCL